MTIKITRVLTPEEFEEINDDAVKNGFWRNDPRILTPGMAWYQPWYWHPDGSGCLPRGSEFLSDYYWKDWADKRAPICVVCPNGEQWEIDRKSSNGNGWVVVGELPDITVSPSILVNGYHGFLRGVQFTADVDGRPPNGIPQPYTKRDAA
ncbi:hypothetical protein [Methylosinus sp. PW1]|uniref:hypothetical protein n=1 Tax=Methylosinus sp. PW1 TaxID=107636 RepID=UPI000B30F160|nr:hypothetical protein [Methylosinus sp. PW1]